jgi:phosphate-selective porin OprO/OprP
VTLVAAWSGSALADDPVATSGTGTTDDTVPLPRSSKDDMVPRPPSTSQPIFDAATLDRIVDARVAAEIHAIPPTSGWNDGFFVQTKDGATRLTIGGYTQFDGRYFVPESSDPKVDQFGFRSIRPDLGGTVFDHYDFRVLTDFAGSKLTLQDAYLDVHYSDAAVLRFGKTKTPFGLERLERDIATTFVERGLPSLLTPNRDLGVQLYGHLARGIVEYEVGIYNGVADNATGDGDVSNGKEGVARVFIKPFATTQSLAKDVGVGAAATYGDRTGTLADPEVALYKTQGQTTFFQYKTGTDLASTVIADGVQWRATGQANWYAGSFGALAEYVRSTQHVSLDGTHTEVGVDSWQVVGQWVLTGDAASFKSISPVHPFEPAKGEWGAFDIAARIGELRLLDTAAFDAKVADPTKSSRRAWSAGAGIDWFPNKNFRFVIDVERTWFRFGAKDDTGMTIDRVPETSVVGRAQTVF